MASYVDTEHISKIITDRVFYLFSETLNRNHYVFQTLTNLLLLPKPRLEPGLKLWSPVSESCTAYARRPLQPPLCESDAAHKRSVSLIPLSFRRLFHAQLFIWIQKMDLYYKIPQLIFTCLCRPCKQINSSVRPWCLICIVQVQQIQKLPLHAYISECFLAWNQAKLTQRCDQEKRKKPTCTYNAVRRRRTPNETFDLSLFSM